MISAKNGKHSQFQSQLARKDSFSRYFDDEIEKVFALATANFSTKSWAIFEILLFCKVLFVGFPFTKFIPYLCLCITSFADGQYCCCYLFSQFWFPAWRQDCFQWTNYNLNFSKPCGMILVTSGNQSQIECNQDVITYRCFADCNLYCTKCNYFVVLVINLLFSRTTRQLIVATRLLSVSGSHFVVCPSISMFIQTECIWARRTVLMRFSPCHFNFSLAS